MPFETTSMDPEGIRFSGIGQTEEEKYRMILLTCGIQNENKTQTTQTKTQLISTENMLVVARGEESEVSEMVKRVKRYRLPGIK